MAEHFIEEDGYRMNIFPVENAKLVEARPICPIFGKPVLATVEWEHIFCQVPGPRQDRNERIGIAVKFLLYKRINMRRDAIGVIELQIDDGESGLCRLRIDEMQKSPEFLAVADHNIAGACRIIYQREIPAGIDKNKIGVLFRNSRKDFKFPVGKFGNKSILC